MTCSTCNVVLGAIEGLIEDNGYAPSLREIMDRTYIASTNTVTVHLRHLRDDCRITFEDDKARTIRVLGEAS